MGIAVTLENYLNTKDINYQLMEHRYSVGSFNTAEAAEIPTHNMLKGVVFRDEDLHYTMVVVPADHRILRHTLNQVFDRHLEMADEDELDDIFFDCERGAIPSFGQAYGLNVVFDDSLYDCKEFWLEAGDHEHLIHLRKREFTKLMKNCMHEHLSEQRQHHRRH